MEENAQSQGGKGKDLQPKSSNNITSVQDDQSPPSQSSSDKDQLSSVGINSAVGNPQSVKMPLTSLGPSTGSDDNVPAGSDVNDMSYWSDADGTSFYLGDNEPALLTSEANVDSSGDGQHNTNSSDEGVKEEKESRGFDLMGGWDYIPFGLRQVYQAASSINKLLGERNTNEQ